MSKAQISMWEEKIVDSFAGGGGASTGIELATGRVVDVAINHDPDAILKLYPRVYALCQPRRGYRNIPEGIYPNYEYLSSYRRKIGNFIFRYE